MDDPELAERLATALRPILRRFLLDETAPGPLGGRSRNVSDFQTIAYLRENGAARTGQIAGFLHVSPTTMQSIVDRLLASGLVAKRRDLSDGRASLISLTTKGQDLSEVIREQDRRNCELMLSTLQPKDRSQLVARIETVAAAVLKQNL